MSHLYIYIYFQQKSALQSNWMHLCWQALGKVGLVNIFFLFLPPI